jgi:TRAP-type C4-dicarboxylate transport system permease small subunit
MDGMQRLRWAVNKVTQGLAYAGMFVLLPLMLLTSADVLGRVFWNKPVPGTVEISSYILVVFIMSGLAYTHQVKGHVRVTMLLDKLPKPVALGMDVLTTLMSMAVLLVVAWQGWEIAWDQNTVSDMLRIAQRPFRLLVTVAGICFFLELLLDLLATLGQLTDGGQAKRA